MSEVILGTFNLNNLFGRYDFKASLADVKNRPARGLKDDQYWTRAFNGELIRPKPPLDRARLAERILIETPDILAVQEVEDRPTLDDFNREELGNEFPYRVLVEGNDTRLIDVGVLSKLPLGEVRSYQHWRHPELPGQPVFRRDFLLVEVLRPDRKRAFWLGVAHLKSRFIDWRVKEETERRRLEQEATRIRKFEAQSIGAIVGMLPKEDLVFVCGDLNDTEKSEALSGLIGTGPKQLVNALAARERDPQQRWTYTHDEPGQERSFEQLDFILTRGTQLARVQEAWVQRRGGSPAGRDASDHDPVFVGIEV